MESRLFSWENYKIINGLKVVFFACTLNSNLFIQGDGVGWHRGAKIEEIEVDYLSGTIKFYDHKKSDRILLAEFLAEMKVWKKI